MAWHEQVAGPPTPLPQLRPLGRDKAHRFHHYTVFTFTHSYFLAPVILIAHLILGKQMPGTPSPCLKC